MTIEEVEQWMQRRARFANWETQRKSVPYTSGLHTIWRDEQLIFVGIAGTGKKGYGLRGHLTQYAQGQRGRDRFSIHIFDHFILPVLTRQQIHAAAAGKLSLDAVTAQFIRDELSFAFIPFEIATAAWFEQEIRAGKWRYGAPLLNATAP